MKRLCWILTIGGGLCAALLSAAELLGSQHLQRLRLDLDDW
jgi:hypothetical protein